MIFKRYFRLPSKAELNTAYLVIEETTPAHSHGHRKSHTPGEYQHLTCSWNSDMKHGCECSHTHARIHARPHSRTHKHTRTRTHTQDICTDAHTHTRTQSHTQSHTHTHNTQHARKHTQHARTHAHTFTPHTHHIHTKHTHIYTPPHLHTHIHPPPPPPPPPPPIHTHRPAPLLPVDVSEGSALLSGISCWANSRPPLPSFASRPADTRRPRHWLCHPF